MELFLIRKGGTNQFSISVPFLFLNEFSEKGTYAPVRPSFNFAGGRRPLSEPGIKYKLRKFWGHFQCRPTEN